MLFLFGMRPRIRRFYIFVLRLLFACAVQHSKVVEHATLRCQCTRQRALSDVGLGTALWVALAMCIRFGFEYKCSVRVLCFSLAGEFA